jgi:hypothetical protein
MASPEFAAVQLAIARSFWPPARWVRRRRKTFALNNLQSRRPLPASCCCVRFIFRLIPAVLPLLNASARVPVCGLIAHYDDTALPPGPDRLGLLMGTILRRKLSSVCWKGRISASWWCAWARLVEPHYGKYFRHLRDIADPAGRQAGRARLLGHSRTATFSR